MLVLALSLVLTQASVESTAPVEAQRSRARLRAGIAAMGGVVLIRPSGWVPGAGITGELGGILNDRLSVSVRPQLFTNIGSWVLGLTPGVDFILSDRLALGLGVTGTLSAGLDSATFLNLFVPVRVTFAPIARRDDAIHRSGLLLGLEVAPGALVGGRPGRFAPGPITAAPSFSAMLTVGWAMW